MAFIQLTNHGKEYPILFNVEHIETIEPKYLNWKHSITRIHYRESSYDVSENFAQVAKLIEEVSVVGGINLDGEVCMRGRMIDGNQTM